MGWGAGPPRTPVPICLSCAAGQQVLVVRVSTTVVLEAGLVVLGRRVTVIPKTLEFKVQGFPHLSLREK